MVSTGYPDEDELSDMIGKTIASRTYEHYHYEVIKQIGEGGVTEGVFMAVMKPDSDVKKPQYKPKICGLKVL